MASAIVCCVMDEVDEKRRGEEKFALHILPITAIFRIEAFFTAADAAPFHLCCLIIQMPRFFNTKSVYLHDSKDMCVIRSKYNHFQAIRFATKIVSSSQTLVYDSTT